MPKLFDQNFKLCLNRKPNASHRNFPNTFLLYAFADIQLHLIEFSLRIQNCASAEI